MKKNVKIIFIILITLVIGTLILVFKDKLLDVVKPNYDDLVCVKDVSNSTVDIKEDSKYIFKFNKEGIINSYVEERVYTFLTEEAAQENYNFFLSYSDAVLELQGTKIFSSIEYIINEKEGYYGKSKSELKEYYEKEFGYLCE